MHTGSPTNYFVHSLLRAREWQHRRQLDDVCDWWRGGGVGVCSLIGIGGAGKTAIADRFLQLLPDVLPEHPDVSKDQSLATPNSVFVFSFYDAPNPEAFFKAMEAWLRRTVPTYTVTHVSASGGVSYHQFIQWLQGAPPGLLILDGMEKIQQDGTRGGIFGRLSCGNLRDFLNRLANGYLPHLSAVITSRFPMADLDEASPTWYRHIDVDEIELQTGIALLRQCGVNGTDDELAAIVENCGRHALTVDMAGGLLVEFHDGDPNINLAIGTPGEIEQAASKEQDPRRRAVLKQELRFAKVAARYHQALADRDEAALALLERVCLFRLGIGAETLASIFTGKGSEEAAGPALSRLSAEELQEKLALLIRMGLLEASPVQVSESESETRYSIHPAVRDGFLNGISRDAALAGHEAVRKGLEVSLGESPGKNPSDPATLDLLEEIVHHTLQSGHVGEAWDIYNNRIGNYRNLGWRLGAYERGERICRAFAGGQSAETVVSQYKHEAQASRPDQAQRRSGNTASNQQKLLPELRRSAPRSGLPATAALRPARRSDGLRPDEAPFLDLPEATQAIFINEWALYLQALGRLAAAARCYELCNEMSMRQEKWSHASQYNQNLCDVWLLAGRLSRLPRPKGGRAGSSRAGALTTADEALRLAELADDAKRRCYSHASHGHTRTLRGDVAGALADFRDAIDWQKTAFQQDHPLISKRGVRHSDLLARLGRREDATRLADVNHDYLFDNWGPDDNDIPNCQLVLSSLSLAGSDSGPSSSVSSAALWTQARDWAQARDAKEVLCWSYLVEAQHALAKYQHDGEGEAPAEPNQETNQNLARQEPRPPDANLAAAHTALESGLKIARDCGYGLFHIDLLLQRARLHLLEGDAGKALDDIEMALDTGIPANERTGQPELLAARAPECGYAWPIPEGLQLRAEAQLLKAAQELGKGSGVFFDSHASDDEHLAAEIDSRPHPVPPEIHELITQAEALLVEALELWQPLHDPEPERDDQNFEIDGQPHNYKAAETHRVLTDLRGGILTRYPIDPNRQVPPQPPEPDRMPNRFQIALSFPGEHRGFVLEVAEALAAKLTRDRVFYDDWYEVELLGDGGDLKLQAMYEQADLIVPFFSECYDKPWCAMEWTTIRSILLHRREDDSVIPVHLDDTNVPGWPAVNFGIRLRGRSAVQIADIILQALEQRQSGEPSGASSAEPTTGSTQPTQILADAVVSTGALAIWREKCDYLQQQEAISADAAQKFALKKQIEEAQQKIQELSGNPS